MTYPMLPDSLLRLRSQVAELVVREIAPRAAETDEKAQWPAHSFAALKRAGVMGLNVPAEHGGLGQGLLALAVLTETIGRGCASSGICFGMHCVGTAVIAAKATPYHAERYLRPIARGEHITTLSLSEGGSGVHFYLSETSVKRDHDGFCVNGTKQFVTNAGHADSYVVSTRASDAATVLGEFNCLLIDREQPGMEWLEPWSGFGMRGNSARGLRLNNVRVPHANLLGQEGDEIWYVFEVVTPYFLVAMAGTYIGVAQAALDETLQHLKARSHVTTAEALSAVPTNQIAVAQMWRRVERARQWLFHAAHAADHGDSQAMPLMLTSKVEAAEAAVYAANEAMTLCGGIAYRENSLLSRLLRDARASHVMSPTTTLLQLWTGRALLGHPML